ncbi:MAG TPA: hypothetical protein VM187_14165 [Niastella sp.]|nr:hypothetical protein [Niastella sp.]
MDYLFIPLANFFQWTFTFMESLANLPNVIFIVGGIFGLVYWCVLQGKFNKQAANTPGQLK